MGRTRVEQERTFRTPIEPGFSTITDIRNWPKYWPDLVRVEPGSRWRNPGDEARLIVRLLGRKVELAMTLLELVPNRLVTYESTQGSLPDAYHERHFHAVDGGFSYRIVIEYESRGGLRGVADRTLVRRGVDRAVRRTMANLDRLLTESPRPSGSGGVPDPMK